MGFETSEAWSGRANNGQRKTGKDACGLWAAATFEIANKSEPLTVSGSNSPEPKSSRPGIRGPEHPVDPSSLPTSSPVLDGLDEAQQVELTNLLDGYLQQLEQGQIPDRNQVLSDRTGLNPEVAEALQLYLGKLEELYQLADVRGNAGSDLAGKILGDYRLEKEIGRGGMGIVFLAHDESLDRTVAVKLLPMAAMLDSKFIERFRVEAQAAASLEHPSIVPVFAVGDDGGIHYYAMRWVDGSSLDQRIESAQVSGQLPPVNSALLQFADIADALHEAHEYGIVHRDIKPSNLLLDKAGKLWVADFGLARVQGDHALTGTGEMIGTMRYMSPEQAHGHSEWVDHRTDIYSLGATLYEFLTATPAVPGPEGPNLLQTIQTQAPIRIRRLRHDVSRDLQTVLEKAMARHRDDRYRTAAEMAEDLRRVARGEPITTRLVSPLQLAGRWLSHHPQMAATLLAVVIMAGVFLTGSVYVVNSMIREARDHAVESLAKIHTLEQDAVIDELTALPGGAPIRRKLVQDRLEYYRSFVSQPTTGERMLGEKAKAYSRIGTLCEQLGDLPVAVENFQSAEELFGTLVAIDGFGSALWHDRFENSNRLSLCLQRMGAPAIAVAVLDDWVNELRAAVATPTAGLPSVVQRGYGLLENNYGLVLQQLPGRSAEAQQAFRKAIHSASVIHEQDSTDLEMGRVSGIAQFNLGSLLLVETGRHQEAVSLLESALRTQLDLAGDSEGLRMSGDLVASYMELGNAYLQRDALHAARLFTRAEEICRQLVKLDPQNDDYRRELGLALSNLGMASYRTGDHFAAEGHLDEAVILFKELLIAYPQHEGIANELAVALNNQGIVWNQRGQQLWAETAYEQAAGLLDPNKSAHRVTLRDVYVNHLAILRTAGRDAEAWELEQLHSALERPSQELVDATP